ncbi:alpha/beta fold hydrolase [Alkalicoccus halolimnae]|uniref:Alpha/beta hydrolase n=1 Tax=Alkalicoccus halolimnae TaxID=1667239 RepID=A0A5C7F9L4_9BACI|nr:alpha/beta hydrolase [Alkalicoccus halolimnae]TXF86763.1 alpha/beta hydrolase [Alkalicoccus halolimnae]
MAHQLQMQDDVKLFVEDIGEGKPIVFIHGWPLNQEMFQYQKEELSARGYRYIGIDLRGYGQSDKPKTSYSYDEMAQDVKQVIHQLDLDSYYLAGFSMGGAIAIRFASTYADEKLERLILLGAAAPSFMKRQGYEMGMEEEDVEQLKHAIEDNREQALKEFGKNFFATDVPQDVADKQLRMGLEASEYATLASLEALRDEDLRDEVYNINVRTTVMHGKKDEICEFGFAEELERTIPNVELIPFEESGHGLIYDERQKLNEELLKLI